MWLISEATNKNNFVLDPFLGSGTTAVACKQLNRKFIGIEINEAYAKISVERLRQNVLSLFDCQGANDKSSKEQLNFQIDLPLSGIYKNEQE
jgi:DNA modification methylase